MADKSARLRSKTKDSEVADLNRLLEVLSISLDGRSELTEESRERYCDEADLLEKVSGRYKEERSLSKHSKSSLLATVFDVLLKKRLLNREWIQNAPENNIYLVIILLRIFLRDGHFQKIFDQHQGTRALSDLLCRVTDMYLSSGESRSIVDLLQNTIVILNNIFTANEQSDWPATYEIHKPLVQLLSAADVNILTWSLRFLIALTREPTIRKLIAELDSTDVLLRILQDYEPSFQKMAAQLLHRLSEEPVAREMFKLQDGIPVFVSMLHNDSVTVLWHVIGCLTQLASEASCREDIRQHGGIPPLVSMLRIAVGSRSSDKAVLESGDEEHEEAVNLVEKNVSLKQACCVCLTELAISDVAAQEMVQLNAIFSLGMLILPQHTESNNRKSVELLQANAFRTLRFIFSLERNRRLFKFLFPPDLFGMFVDVGAYQRSLAPYQTLVTKINALSDDVIETIEKNIKAINTTGEPMSKIRDYAVMEVLGSGAFGTVYKVRKPSTDHYFLALKEINTLNMSWGRNSKERQQSVGDAMQELTIMRKQLQHPNIVKYHKAFMEQDKLFIVMELIEGAPLAEHFSSLIEKKETFTEERIWRIFIQILLAMRYLHKEKSIVHRDLTPNNIMMGEHDKVTITDFGLAKQKNTDCSKMTSVVGTILYSCPEIVQSQPYGEKADIWAMGCVLYQMATLKPPFFSNNMLTLAQKIVTAEYVPIADGQYSSRVASTVSRCLTADPNGRPDVISLSGHIADVVLSHYDACQRKLETTEKNLDKERRRMQRHVNMASNGVQSYGYQAQLSASREGYCSDSGLRLSKVSTPTDPRYRGCVSISENAVCLSSENEEASSGNESREGSANGHHGDLRHVPKPPPGSVPVRMRHRMDLSPSVLTIDGMSSDDQSPSSVAPADLRVDSDSRLQRPSSGDGQGGVRPGSGGRPPQPQRSISSSALEHFQRTATVSNSRSNSPGGVTAVAFSPHKVREINDPIQQLLTVLHKLIFISQLPPTHKINPHRQAIDKFKRVLFAPHSSSTNLKNELRKLVQCSHDFIDLNFPGSVRKLCAPKALDGKRLSFRDKTDIDVSDQSSDLELGITYEQMGQFIENVLAQNGYYSNPANQ